MNPTRPKSYGAGFFTMTQQNLVLLAWLVDSMIDGKKVQICHEKRVAENEWHGCSLAYVVQVLESEPMNQVFRVE